LDAYKISHKMVKEGEKLVRRRLKFWKVPVTPLLDELLEKAIERNTHVSKSDFIREAVREKLQRMGLMETLTQEDRQVGGGDADKLVQRIGGD